MSPRSAETVAATAPGRPQGSDACRSPNCRAAIRWTLSVSGERVPVDYSPDPAGDLVRVRVGPNDWRVRVLEQGETPPADAVRWTSHFATCPDASRFRKPRTRPAPARRPASAPVAAGPPLLLAVDGNSLAHRAFHAYERSAMTGADGRPVFAVYGFLALLAGIVDKIRPAALVVGFDDPGASRRREAFDGYKAGRPERDPALYAQMAESVDILGELGVPVVTAGGWEADDVTASAAAAAERAGWRCVIATSDKDAWTQISASTSVLRLVSGLDNAQLIDPAVLLAEHGVTPAQRADYVAMVGDKSDNLCGVDGIGPKRALALLAACGSLDAALADPAAAVAAIGKAAAAKLTTPEAAAAIARNRELMAPVRDIPVDPDACRLRAEPGPVAEVLRGRGFPGLADRLAAALCPPVLAPSPAPVAAVPDPAPGERLEAPPGLEVPAPGQRPTCGACGLEGIAHVQLVDRDGLDTGERVLVALTAHWLGDLVRFRRGPGGSWLVRRLDGQDGATPAAVKLRAHRCPEYPDICVTCGAPARLYPGGRFCDDHRPRSTERAAQSRDDT